MKKLIETELKEILNIFMEFNTTYCISILIEVYLAKLKTGEQVVIKVQRPNVRKNVI